MKKIFPLVIALVIFVLASCAKVDEEARKNVESLTYPVASFTFSGNEGPAPVDVSFHNSSEYCDKYEWTFHNGSKSDAFEPTFHYVNGETSDITYLVTLTVTDSGTGLTNTRSKSVVVHPMQ